MARAYLEAVLSILGFWRSEDICGTAGAVLGNLNYGAVIGPGNVTLGGSAVMGPVDSTLGCGNVLRHIAGRDVGSIFCMFLIDCIS